LFGEKKRPIRRGRGFCFSPKKQKKLFPGAQKVPPPKNFGTSHQKKKEKGGGKGKTNPLPKKKKSRKEVFGENVAPTWPPSPEDKKGFNRNPLFSIEKARKESKESWGKGEVQVKRTNLNNCCKFFQGRKNTGNAPDKGSWASRQGRGNEGGGVWRTGRWGGLCGGMQNDTKKNGLKKRCCANPKEEQSTTKEGGETPSSPK